jgi:outer membrane protein W
LTPRQALRALLARSNLQVTQGADGVFVIKPRPAIATVIIPPPVAPQGTAAPVAAAPPAPLTARASAGPWLVGLGAEFSQDSAGATGGASAAFSGEYFITDQIAAALSATTPRSDSFSSAVTLKYYFAPESRLDPFLGAGLDVTRLDRVMAGASVQAGLDVLLNAHWMINAGVSWAQVRIDRVQFGLGFVYRFGASGDL